MKPSEAQANVGVLPARRLRTRKLLAAAALVTSAFDSSCKKEAPLPGNPKGSMYADDAVAPLPGNPKGSFYDDASSAVPSVADAQAAAQPVDASTVDAAARDAGAKQVATPKPDAGPKIHGLPGNPKGSRYGDDDTKL